MKGDIAMEKLGVLVLVMIMTAIGLQIISSLKESAAKTDLQVKKAYPDVNYPYCSDYSSGQEITKQQFYKILYYRLDNTCNLTEQKVTSGFVLKKQMLEEKARELGLVDSSGDLLVFYRGTCSKAENLDLQGLSVGKTEKEFLYRPGDEIKFVGTGKEVALC
ncbi:MAG: hypothetical protein ABEJ87_01580 [Candidatus Nanohalobium sp.]